MILQFISGFGAQHSEKAQSYVSIDLAGIRALVDEPPSVDKLQAQWFIPSTLMTRTFREQETNGEFWMLWADLDQNPPTIDAVADLLRPLEVDYEIYASRSATKEIPKCRILIPLAQPLSGKRWSLCQEILNDLLEQGNAAPDRANERCGQLCFLPNKGTYYEVAVRRDNVFLDTAHVWADKLAEKEVALRTHEEAIEVRRARARERKASANISGESNLIAVFNAQYPVEDILLQAGYEQRGNRFRHPNSQSGSFSAGVQDGRVNSLSTADPLYSNGQGAHDAFSAYTVLFAGGDSNRALQQAGDEMVRIGEESWNAVKRREYAIAHAPEPMDFTELLNNSKAKVMQGQSTLEVETVIPKPTPEPEPIKKEPPVFSLQRFVLNGQSARLEAQMLEEKYVLDGIAIYGQITVIYAPPNAGKTLITLKLLIEAIESGEMDPAQIFFINADDGGNAKVIKLKIAEEVGFQYLTPNESNEPEKYVFKPEDFTDLLQESINNGSAHGKVVILDTAKKFTDIMSKRDVTEFCKVLRTFVQVGGTAILLAHVNKHRDAEDKLIFAGTTDLIDDADCAFTLDAKRHSPTEFYATFENKKARGNVVHTVTYSYSSDRNQSYRELLQTVKLITEEEADASAKAGVILESLEKNSELIHVLISIMNEGLSIKGEIVQEAKKRTDLGKDTVNKVLKTHTGEYFSVGHRWTVKEGDKNAKLFTLLKEFQKPITPAEPPPSESSVFEVKLAANSASTANSITTGGSIQIEIPQTAANTANSFLNLYEVDGADEWRMNP